MGQVEQSPQSSVVVSLLLIHAPRSGLGFILGCAFGLGVSAIFFGAMFCLRGNVVGVVLSEADAQVIGWFTKRTIPRAQISNVAFQPTIVWTDESGRARLTSVAGLKVSTSSGMNTGNDENLRADSPVRISIGALRSWALDPKWVPGR